MESLDQQFVVKLYRQLAPASALQLAVYAIGAFAIIVIANVIRQFLPRRKSEPPLVFHWVPFIGNAVAYGRDPCDFMMHCREKVPTTNYISLCLSRSNFLTVA